MSLLHIRFPGLPYIDMASTVQQMKLKGAAKKTKKSGNSLSSHNIQSSSSSRTKNAKKAGRSTSTISSSSKDSKDAKPKAKKRPTRNLYKTVGDTVVEKLDELGHDDLDVNANPSEPLPEQISKDIALAVAMIVAEHEMLKRKYPGKYPDNNDQAQRKRKGKSVPSAGSKTELDKVQSSESLPALEVDAPATLGQPETDSPPQEEIAENSEQTPNLPDLVVDETPPKLPPSPTVQPRKGPKGKGKSAPVAGALKKPSSAVPRFKSPSPARGLSATSLRGLMAPQPSFGAKAGILQDVLKYVAKVQSFMNNLGYQRVGEPKISINARLSMKMQMFMARELIAANQPIKCLHAVVLAVHFTNCLSCVERFPIYFRSHVGSKEYKHIVLGIYVQGHFGALGISRDGGLQDKPTSFSRLSDLIFEFAKCYGQSGHILNEVKFGNIITHDQHSLEKLFSKNYVVPIAGCHQNDIDRNVERFARQLRSTMALSCLKPSTIIKVEPSLSSQNIQTGRLSRSKTSINLSSSSRSSLRSRALSVGPGPGSSPMNTIQHDELSKKIALTRSRPVRSGTAKVK